VETLSKSIEISCRQANSDIEQFILEGDARQVGVKSVQNINKSATPQFLATYITAPLDFRLTETENGEPTCSWTVTWYNGSLIGWLGKFKGMGTSYLASLGS
jgi:hypothetical protein